MQVILDFLFASQGSAPIGGGKKGEFRDWTTETHENFAEICVSMFTGFRVTNALFENCLPHAESKLFSFLLLPETYPYCVHGR